MKATQVVAKEEWNPDYTCMVCGKKIAGYYGRWGEGGVCSKACDKVEHDKRYPKEEQCK